MLEIITEGELNKVTTINCILLEIITRRRVK